MAENELVITLTLKDEVTAHLTGVAGKLDEFAENAKRLGREIGQVGQTIALTGASITGPFILAIKKASETSTDLKRALNSIDTSFTSISSTIAKALVPIINNFSRMLFDLSNWFNGLNATTRDAIVQFTFLAGVFLTVGGGLTIVIGKVISLASNIASLTASFYGFAILNPHIVLIIAGITTLIFLMFKFSEVTKQVLNAVQSLSLLTEAGFFQIKIALENFVSSGLMNLAKLYDALAGLPGPLQDFYRIASLEAQNAANVLRGFAANDMQQVKDVMLELQGLMSGRDGGWAEGFGEIKSKIDGIISSFQNLSAAGKGVADNLKINFSLLLTATAGVLGQLSSALTGMAAQNKKFAGAAKAVAYGMAIINTAEGITNVWAKWGAFPPVAAAFSAIVAAAGALQMATISNQSFAVGTANVPSDMMATVHRGETIVPATFADSIRRGELSLSGGGGGGGDITINLFDAHFNNDSDARRFTEMIGFEVERKARNARSIL